MLFLTRIAHTDSFVEVYMRMSTHTLIAIDCALSISDDGVGLNTVFEVQDALSSEMTPFQLISEREYQETFLTLCKTLNCDPENFMSYSLQPSFLFEKLGLRTFMKENLPVYTPKFLALDQLSKEALNLFYDDCVREGTTDVVIKYSNGSRGEFNFFMTLPSCFEDFYQAFYEKVNALKRNKSVIRNGLFTKIFRLSEKNLILEQCRNVSFNPEKQTAETYRIVLEIESENYQLKNLAFRVVSMQQHRQYNSHECGHDICFFDHHDWETSQKKYVAVTKFTPESPFAILEEKINNAVMLKADMRRMAFAILAECQKLNIEPEKTNEQHSSLMYSKSFSVFQKSVCSAFFEYTSNQLEDVVELTGEIFENQISEWNALKKALCKLPPSTKIKLEKDTQVCSPFIAQYGVILNRRIASAESNVPFLAGIIIKLNAPDKLIVKKMLLTLLLGTNGTEDSINSRTMLANGFSVDDLRAIIRDVNKEDKVSEFFLNRR